MQERREFRRFNSLFDIRYTKVKGPMTINSLSATRDIGFGGMSTRLSQLIKKGDDILVELNNIYNNKTVAALVRVVWLETVIDKGYNKCGLKFLWISSKSALNDCISYAESVSEAA